MKSGTGSLTVHIVDPAVPVTKVESNAVTAPGPPGSVDKGEVQTRGQKLEISNRAPEKAMKMRVELVPTD